MNNPSLPSTTTSNRPFLSSPFLNPTPLCLTPQSLPKRRRFKVAFPRNYSTSPSESPSVTATTTSNSDIWGPRKELVGIQPIVDKLSPPVRLATSAVVIAAAVFAGFNLGSKFGRSRNVAIGGATVMGAAGGALAYALSAAVPEVAAKRLHDYVADYDDPGAVKKEDIEAIASKYGVSKQDPAFNAELSDIYCRFVTSILPSGGEDLKGDEVDKIVKFKSALGIEDPDAAAMHMEIGRRIFRQRLEVGDRDGDIEQRRAFQKLIYVSTLVFGEASSFLLPWKRVFKVTDSQVEIAIRDNAKCLYVSKLKSVGRGKYVISWGP